MNKGFILDGYPRNQNDAKAIFCNEIPGYFDDEEEKKEEEKKEPEKPQKAWDGEPFLPQEEIDRQKELF